MGIKNKSLAGEQLKLMLKIVFSFVILIISTMILVSILTSTNIVMNRYNYDSLKTGYIDNIESETEFIKFLDSLKYDYNLYSNGNVIKKNISDKENLDISTILDQKKDIFTYNANYKYIEKDDYKALLRIPNLPEFRNHKLRELLDFNLVTWIFPLSSFVLIFFIFIITYIKRINNEFNKILVLCEEIGQGVIETCEVRSDIREFNMIIDSIHSMKNKLSGALLNEINIENERRIQIAGLLHDIKNPLTIILGNTELLSMTDMDDEQETYLNYILESCEKVESYTKEIINFSKNKNKLKIDLEQVNAYDFISKLATNMRQYFSHRNIDFRINIDKELKDKYFRIDISRMERALVNILVNAGNYTDKKNPIVSLKSRIKEDLEISIEDTGIGFSEEDKLNATKLFYKKNNNGEDVNFGLGLTFANEIIEEHRGKIQLIDSEDYKGAKVVVKLPISD